MATGERISSADLETFSSEMSDHNVHNWFAHKLNRKPVSSDMYMVAKDLYNLGQYAKAIRALEVYVTMPGKELAGLHLLGYAYYMYGNLPKAIKMFEKCVNSGFDSDWQLLIEIQIELENKKEEKL